MPNSKSWVKLQASVDDPTLALRDLALNLPLTLGAFPWVWDFGTTRWTYGSMRAATDSVILTDTVGVSPTGEWTVSSGPKGRELAAETSGADTATFGGWGHLQGAKEVVAYAVEGVKTRRGTYRIAIDGTGQTTFQLTPPVPQAKHELTVYCAFRVDAGPNRRGDEPRRDSEPVVRDVRARSVREERRAGAAGC